MRYAMQDVAAAGALSNFSESKDTNQLMKIHLTGITLVTCKSCKAK